jgi:hypothetical protein
MYHEQLFNASEQQLADFCQANMINKMQLTLKGQGNFQHISPVGLNICCVSIRIMGANKYYYFGCIREHIYIELLYKFDHRHKKRN